MQTVHVVTDSSAHFASPHAVPNVSIVPNILTIDGKRYREGVDISTEEAMHLIGQQPSVPTVQPPSIADYLDVFGRLSRDCEGIISIHASRELSGSWANAKTAAQQLMGHCKMMVIDSRTLSTAQGLLARLALRAIGEHPTFDDVVRVVRGAVERLYSVYYVESLEFLMQNQLLAPSHSVLSMMLNVKPVLTLEAGQLVPMEKVRTRAQGIERIVEFAAEFIDIEDALIVQPKAGVTEGSRQLQERLAVEFPNRHFLQTVYGASLAALIGTDATGLVILEREEDGTLDDF